jgi:uncharacterized protein
MHFQHGPIDLIVAAEGDARAVQAAYRAAWERFDGLLPELVAELGALRAAVTDTLVVRGSVARRMLAACRPHGCRPQSHEFITSMAAVAGAVADEVLGAMTAAAPLARAYVNNGGDIALHLAADERFRVGLAAESRHGHARALDGAFEIDASLAVRGIATSGWRGRSLSLGIADAVTVLARDAAAADAAATMIANAVDVDDPAIERARACDVRDDTDLGTRRVTIGVGALPPDAIAAALDRGAAHALECVNDARIWGAILRLQGEHRVVGGLAAVACV